MGTRERGRKKERDQAEGREKGRGQMGKESALVFIHGQQEIETTVSHLQVTS
jgi:hypothetical protein